MDNYWLHAGLVIVLLPAVVVGLMFAGGRCGRDEAERTTETEEE